MSVLFKIIAIAFVTILANILVKQTRPEIALIISLVGSILIIIMTIDSLKQVMSNFFSIFEITGINNNLLSPLFKIIAIGYIAEFASNICVDAGASSIADKILFAAKVVILLVSLPIVKAVVNMVVGLLWKQKDIYRQNF